jgi:hypothetical protein
MKSKEDVVVGLQTFPEDHCSSSFNGENFGKLVLGPADQCELLSLKFGHGKVGKWHHEDKDERPRKLQHTPWGGLFQWHPVRTLLLHHRPVNSDVRPPKDGKTGHHPPASICFHEVALSWAAGVASVAIADAKQAQQTGEQVKERDEQANRGQHVIGFPAVHDAAGFKQDQSCR